MVTTVVFAIKSTTLSGFWENSKLSENTTPAQSSFLLFLVLFTSFILYQSFSFYIAFLLLILLIFLLFGCCLPLFSPVRCFIFTVILVLLCCFPSRGLWASTSHIWFVSIVIFVIFPGFGFFSLFFFFWWLIFMSLILILLLLITGTFNFTVFFSSSLFGSYPVLTWTAETF